MSVRYECGNCGKQAWFHQNVGGSLLWCEDCGVLAVQVASQELGDPVKQMTDEQYKEFVKEG